MPPPEDPQTEKDRRRSRDPGKVVRLPRDWLGPREELVPLSPEPPSAEDFWGEGSAAVQDALQAPRKESVRPRERAVPERFGRWRRWSQKPEGEVPEPARRRRARVLPGVVVVAAGVIGALVIASSGEKVVHRPISTSAGAALGFGWRFGAVRSSEPKRARRAVIRRHRARKRPVVHPATAVAQPVSTQVTPAYSAPVSGEGGASSGGGGSGGGSSGGGGAGPVGAGAAFGPGKLG